MKKVIFVFLGLLAAFAAGRFLTPEKVKIETKTVEVEKKTEKHSSDTDRHKKTVTHTITKPDGTSETTTTTTDDIDRHTASSETDKSSKSAEYKKEVTRSSSPVTLSLVKALHLNDSAYGDFGVSITKPIIGPITVGAIGLKSGVVGVSLGLTF